jgi:hypothetical protein
MSMTYGIIAYFVMIVVLASVSNFWLFAIPLAYAVGDFYPWTGGMLVTEADLMCATVASVLLWQNGRAAMTEAFDRRFLWLWGPLLVSGVVSLAIGWSRLPTAIAGDELSLYGSNLNALRIAKGYVWGTFFAPFVIAAFRSGGASAGPVLAGIRTGALIVGALIVWERLITVGLFNADDPYRATGPMFSSHIGGMQVDAYWAATLPVLMIPPRSARRLAAWIGYGLLLVLAYFAVASTMSRGIILLAACQSVALIGIVMIHLVRQRTTSAAQIFGELAVGAGVLVGTFVMIASSEAMWSRLAGVSADWDVRWSQWTGLCKAASVSGPRVSVGNGIGTLPNLLAAIDQLPARPISLAQSASGGVVLRLEPGRSVYVEQLVDANAPGPWRLSVDADNPANTTFGFHVCRKTLYRSFECLAGRLPRSSDRVHPAAQVVDLDVARLQSGRPNFLRPPITFALSVGGRDSYVDIASVRLEDANGRNLLCNEDFKSGSRFWFFTSDQLSAWRADNLWVHLYVEHGMLGVIAIAWLVLGTLWLAVRAAARRFDLALMAFSIGIAGFLAIGTIGSLLDTANLTALFLLYVSVVQAIASSVNGRPMKTNPMLATSNRQQAGGSGTPTAPLADPPAV